MSVLVLGSDSASTGRTSLLYFRLAPTRQSIAGEFSPVLRLERALGSQASLVASIFVDGMLINRDENKNSLPFPAAKSDLRRCSNDETSQHKHHRPHNRTLHGRLRRFTRRRNLSWRVALLARAIEAAPDTGGAELICSAEEFECVNVCDDIWAFFEDPDEPLDEDESPENPEEIDPPANSEEPANRAAHSPEEDEELEEVNSERDECYLECYDAYNVCMQENANLGFNEAYYDTQDTQRIAILWQTPSGEPDGIAPADYDGDRVSGPILLRFSDRPARPSCSTAASTNLLSDSLSVSRPK